MQYNKPQIPKKYQPRGFEIIHEDKDLIVGSKAAGVLTVSAKWEKNATVQNALNQYVRKGSSVSKKNIYVVHRLDQATTGLLVFAKSEEAQQFLKDNWSDFEKHYFTVVAGKPPQAKGMVESYLEEDEDYVVHSNTVASGKLAKTQYEVLASSGGFSLLKIRLLTGRKNQIRVHMADLGCPVAGDAKYGGAGAKGKQLALHAYSLEINHPFNGKRLKFLNPPPAFFKGLVPFDFDSYLKKESI